MSDICGVSYIEMSFLDLLATLNPWWTAPRERRERQHPRRRAIFSTLLDAIESPSEDRRATVLAGPRQSGKSTLLGQLIDHLLDADWPPGNVLYYDFFDQRGSPAPSLDAIVEHRPASRASVGPPFFVFDEVTRAPGWAASLKRLVDDSRRQPEPIAARYLVSDSAASVLHAGIQDALQGRTKEHRLSGLSFSEFLGLGAPTDEPASRTYQRSPELFDRFVSLGGFPGLHAFDDYVEARRRIRDDIADLAIARDLDREGVDVPRVRDLFAYLVRDSGSTFNASERARDLASGGSTLDARTVRRWVELLEQCCLLARLEPWSPLDRRQKAGRQLVARPKIYAEDHGLVAAFDPRPDPLNREQVRDRVFETLVFSHLRDHQRRRAGIRLSYYGDTGGELDFIVDSPEGSTAVEVTTSAAFEKHVGRSLKACSRAGIERLVLVHDGAAERVGDGWTAVGAARFLLELDSLLEGA